MTNLQDVMEALNPVFETLVDHNPGKKKQDEIKYEERYVNLFYNKIKNKIPKNADIILYTIKIVPEGIASGMSFITNKDEKLLGKDVIKDYGDFLDDIFEYGPMQLFKKRGFLKGSVKRINIQIHPKMNMYEIIRS